MTEFMYHEVRDDILAKIRSVLSDCFLARNYYIRVIEVNNDLKEMNQC